VRIAFISDIHGSQFALESVLSDIENRKVDKVICLGDIATLGSQPKKTIEILQAIEADFVLGNNDEAIIDYQKANRSNIPKELIPSLEWTISRIGTNEIDFIKTFKNEIDLHINNNTNILCYHGSPKSNIDKVLYTTTEKNLDKMFQNKLASIYVGGHVHIQMKRYYKESLMINPGSVGFAFKQFPMPGKDPNLQTWAEYAILDVYKKVTIIEMYQVEFDIQRTIKSYENSDNPMKELYLKHIGIK